MRIDSLLLCVPSFLWPCHVIKDYESKPTKKATRPVLPAHEWTCLFPQTCAGGVWHSVVERRWRSVSEQSARPRTNRLGNEGLPVLPSRIHWLAQDVPLSLFSLAMWTSASGYEVTV